ncbi:16S rRNA (adenine(1518)-N(6)/adenine(1519)-N(6))-dimethyltransferase RsmA [Desulfoplanes formicivorans]|uniref:Ribosomal RNA small subunit methyltransferase A n=1 Tax=Desulfoplanes formicivorans TaxID=1592317 RepID=A0A194AKJ2_9BACT|nr:16S rRNA (adenine(1518)-N(6)/adenine(1519)-N(6))-dimethyltransferase RsmA [Desulfoplanes formicivorans]GAU09571.1 dimethyladenosine transferase [Desulfoplanes formicivorans]
MTFGHAGAGTHRPKKSLGQNFLVDGNVIRKIVDQLAIEAGDTVFEIGPGRGALTRVLAQKAQRLFVLEKDRDLVYALKAQLPDLGCILGDGLDFVWETIGALPSLKVVGNLPYNVASPIMWEVFSRVCPFTSCCFMVQKEVALRLTARPGSKTYGGLSVWVQTFAVPRILFHVSPSCFYPRPKVDSTVVGFKQRPFPAVDHAKLAQTIHLLFQKRRKQLGNILKHVWSEQLEAWLEHEGIDRRARPESLTPEQFVTLTHCL